ncbi:hypothetical protein GCM10010394_55600 [Streptomyces crystallinus]|uniref:Uncharacterized protein n=1 Tax=Streptomyces crystallinus TaxID=68191 RepID=A0ABP3RVI3_9ACTN
MCSAGFKDRLWTATMRERLAGERDRWLQQLDGATLWLIDNVATYAASWPGRHLIQFAVEYAGTTRMVMLSERDDATKVQLLLALTVPVQRQYFGGPGPAPGTPSPTAAPSPRPSSTSTGRPRPRRHGLPLPATSLEGPVAEPVFGRWLAPVLLCEGRRRHEAAADEGARAPGAAPGAPAERRSRSRMPP